MRNSDLESVKGSGSVMMAYIALINNMIFIYEGLKPHEGLFICLVNSKDIDQYRGKITLHNPYSPSKRWIYLRGLPWYRPIKRDKEVTCNNNRLKAVPYGKPKNCR